MRSLSLARLDLKRLFTGPGIVAVAVAVILVVPLLYGALYLWAFWDPYSHMKDIPVAVVNQDVAARSGESTITAGADLVDTLRDTGSMRWEVMSSQEASAALRDHTVYMALSVPRDFSATLASADSSKPATAALTVTIDEADNMLASQIGARVLSEVRAAASASASKGYFDAMWIGLADARDGMSKAATGAVKLSGGLIDARDGSVTLRSGLATARGGATTLQGGLKTLADGTATLRRGAKTADAGASTLAGKLTTARDGATQVDGGAAQLATGLGSLSTGLDTLAASGEQLTGSASALAAASAQVEAGVKSAVDSIGNAADAAGALHSGASQTQAALESYIAAHPDAASDPALAGALAGARQVSGGLGTLASQLSGAGDGGKALADGATGLHDGAVRLSSGLDAYAAGVAESSSGASQALTGARTVAGGTSRLAGGMTAAASGAHTLAGGTSKLAAGASQLASGAVAARSGSVSLTDGLTRLSAGAGTLATGLRSAASGSSTLASGLTAGVAAMPNDPQALTDKKSAIMSDPVALDTVKRTAVANYGTGFAPYFIPLALWVGALVTFFLLKPISGRALMSDAPNGVVALAGYWPAALIGGAQSAIMIAVVQTGLGLTLRLPVLTYAIGALAALTFVALVQFFILGLGSAPGKLAGIVVLMLQLTSAAGTFPLETVPTFFKVIHPFLPMTYVVDALRQTIAGGDVMVVARCALALLGFLALGMIGTLLAVRRQRTVTMGRLHPALSM